MRVFALRLHPATPGWDVRCGCVCLGSGLGCAPPLLAGVCWGVHVGVRAPPRPRDSWLGRAAWVCVFGFGFWLRPTTPGLGVGVCVCWCGRSPCTPPLLAAVCSVGVCVWVRVRLRPATPAWVVGVCVCWCGRSACTLPLLAGVCGVGVCAWARVLAAPCHSWLGCWGTSVLVFALRLYLATPRWGVRPGCVCLCSGFGCAPPLMAWVFRCVCAGVRAPPVPRHSWLGCALWVCVLGLRFWLRPATPGWGVWCVGWLLPGTCSCAVVRCVLCALPGWPLLLGSCPRAVVVAGGLPLWCASWSGVGAPRPLRSGRSRCSGRLSCRRGAFLHPWGACAPGFTGWLRGARGGQPRTGLIVPAAGPRRGRDAGLAPRRTRSGPRNGVVPGGSLRRRSWAACAALVGMCGPGH